MRAEQLKGHLDPLILAVLEAGPAHGYRGLISFESGSEGVFDLPEGTIYPALHRLERVDSQRVAARSSVDVSDGCTGSDAGRFPAPRRPQRLASVCFDGEHSAWGEPRMIDDYLADLDARLHVPKR